MSEALLVTERRPDGSAWITLDRPEIHNAFDERLIAELTAALGALASDAGGAGGGADRQRQELLGRRRPQLDAPDLDLRRGREPRGCPGARPAHGDA